MIQFIALGHVLVDILGGTNRDTDLYIDMAFIAAPEVRIIRDNPAIVNGLAPNLMDTCVVTVLGWISISSHHCFLRKWLRKSLCPLALLGPKAAATAYESWQNWNMLHGLPIWPEGRTMGWPIFPR